MEAALRKPAPGDVPSVEIRECVTAGETWFEVRRLTMMSATVIGTSNDQAGAEKIAEAG